MTGFNEFLKVFGECTVRRIVEIILAFVFLFLIYKKVKAYLIQKYEVEKEKSEQLKEALDAVRNYPKYREQSVEIQKHLESEISELRTSIAGVTESLRVMEEQAKRKDRNRIRDSLLQNYRFYTNTQHNPNKSWTEMEANAFWELFSDYEAVDGDGYMHSVVQPEMTMLTVVPMDDTDKIAELMQTRR